MEGKKDFQRSKCGSNCADVASIEQKLDSMVHFISEFAETIQTNAPV
jgi:hypothetical protein